MIDFIYEPGNSILHRMGPSAKFTGLILFSIIILITNGFLCAVISVIIISSLLLISGLSWRTVVKPLNKLVFFLVMIFMMNILFYTDEICLFRYGFICISKKGFLQGFTNVLHIFSITVLSSFFIRTTTTVEIMKGLENLMQPLRVLGVPTKDIALIMSIALQFIPVFFTDIERIRKAQITRGADLSEGSVIGRIKSIYPLIIPAFISAFRHADDLASAIEARGFQSENDLKRSQIK